MKTIRHIFILFLLYPKLYGQIVLDPIDPAIEISAGYRMTQNDFYGQLNSLNNFSTSRPMFLVGITISDHFARNAGSAFRKVTFNQIIPQSITINDTINTEIRGFIFSAGAGSNLFRKSKTFHLYLGLGVNAGRIKLYKKDYINKLIPIITPKLIIKPTFFFNRFYVDLNIEYDYDFINSKWKNIGDNQYNDISINKINYTSLTTTFGIGCFFSKQ
jgi:hypothetical protein